MESPDADIVAAVLAGDSSRFEEIVHRYQGRLFATARRHSRREDDVEDIVQQIFLRMFRSLGSWRGDAPFEHWVMRIAINVCYDSLRAHQRNREDALSQLTDDETAWLENHAPPADDTSHDADAARALVRKALDQLSPAARIVLTLLEIEDRPIKEIAQLTGWSPTLVKVRAFRARAEMRRVLARMGVSRYL